MNEHEMAVIDYHKNETLKPFHDLEYENKRKSRYHHVMKQRIVELKVN